MDLERIRELFDVERRTLEYSDGIREVSGSVVRHVSRYSEESTIVFSDLDDEDVSVTIAEEIGYFSSLGHDLEWKTYSHDRPADLANRLKRAGFSIGEAEVVLVAEVTSTINQPIDCKVEVKRLSDPDHIEDYKSVSSRVWGGGSGRRIMETMRSDPESIGVYVAYCSGTPVGSSRSTFHSNSVFSGLWGGAVLPEYRGRGVYRSMVRQRAIDAQSFGARYLQVDALPTSRPILERLGFQGLSVTRPCVWRRESK